MSKIPEKFMEFWEDTLEILDRKGKANNTIERKKTALKIYIEITGIKDIQQLEDLELAEKFFTI